MSKQVKRLVGTAILGTGVLVAGGVFVSCLEKIPAGYSGVVYSLNGGVTGEVLGQGMHLLSPFEHIAKYPVSTETMYLSKEISEGNKEDDSFNISTRDGKMVNVDAELSYHYDHDMLDEVYTKWRGKKPSEIEDTYIRARVKSTANEITSQYGVMDVYGEKRTELNTKVFKALEKELAEDGIVIETFNFTRIEPDAQTQKAIQEKVNAQQELEKIKIEAQKQEVENDKQIKIKEAEAKQRMIEAQAQAERISVNAEAEANAIRVKAEAQAEANRKLAESLTDKVIQSEYIKAWEAGGSKVPQVQGQAATIIDLMN